MLGSSAPSVLRRWHLRAVYGDAFHSLIKLLFVLSVVSALAAAIFVFGSYLITSTGGTRQSDAVSRLSLSVPRVPSRPVEHLERIDLSTVVTNPTNARLENIALELAVLDSRAQQVLSARQSRIALQPNDSRAVYWQWRIPGQLPAGAYDVRVTAFDSRGNVLAGAPSPDAQLLIAD